MSGISMTLSRLNEVILPEISEKEEMGKVLVAGGGKFTARFDSLEQGRQARDKIVKILSTWFPMLEFQFSEIHSADRFADIKESIMKELKTHKQNFRGYGLSYNPHFKVCDECCEYPAESKKHRFGVETCLCRICDTMQKNAKISTGSDWFFSGSDITSIEKIYNDYLEGVKNRGKIKIPYNLEDMFSRDDDKDDPETSERKRMAVWFSDINSMKSKVMIWLNQDENQVFDTFKQVRDVFSDVVTRTLKTTFKTIEGAYLPFRIIIAGGDDLCLVMDERYILDFAANLSSSLHDTFKELGSEHPLNHDWLRDRLQRLEAEMKEKNPDFNMEKIQPYCFGGSFVVCSTHTPFTRVHSIGEELMKHAKIETNRLGNSVNWRVMAEEESQTDKLLPFERPLFIESHENADHPSELPDGWKRLGFKDYLVLRRQYSGISASHRHQIADKMIECNGNPVKLERWLIKHASSAMEKSFTGLLNEKLLRTGSSREGGLMPDRLVTLLELLSIGGKSDACE
jgi:hypothetical protein